MRESLIKITPTNVEIAQPESREKSFSQELLDRRQSGYSQRETPGRSPFERKQKQMSGDRNFEKKKKPRNNFFTQQLDRFGEDFLSKMRPQDFSQNNLERIIRELAKGRCDLNMVGQYIANPIMLRQLIIFCSEQYNRMETIRNALDISLRLATEQHVNVGTLHVKLLEEHKGKAALYWICIQKFTELQNTGDSNILISLVNELYRYSYVL